MCVFQGQKVLHYSKQARHSLSELMRRWPVAPFAACIHGLPKLGHCLLFHVRLALHLDNWLMYQLNRCNSQMKAVIRQRSAFLVLLQLQSCYIRQLSNWQCTRSNAYTFHMPGLIHGMSQQHVSGVSCLIVQQCAQCLQLPVPLSASLLK